MMSITDKALRSSILAELDIDRGIDSGDLAVAVQGGVVTLSGHVSGPAQRLRALEIAKEFDQVRAIVNEIEVRSRADTASDEAIARAAVQAFVSIPDFPIDKVRVVVEHGVVTLMGEVEQPSELRSAEQILLPLEGIVDVRNRLQLRSHVPQKDTKGRIEESFGRTDLDSRSIRVETRDGVVLLTGNVPSWFDRDLAERLAWAAPGVRLVENRLEITHPAH